MKSPTNENYQKWCAYVKKEEGYTLSTCTLRTHDLCAAAISLFEEIDPEFLADEARDNPEGMSEFERLSELPWLERGEHEEALSYLWEALYERAQELAPDGFFFGASEGDGAHLGWFKYEDEEADDDDPHGEEFSCERVDPDRERFCAD